MLNKNAFAKSIAAVIAIMYAAFYLIGKVAPASFEYLFNAQFLGADIASMVPTDMTFGSFVGILVTITVMGWVLGYLWASLYNKFK